MGIEFTLVFFRDLSGWLAALCATLWGARGFSRVQRRKYPALKILDGKQVLFLTGVLAFGLLAMALSEIIYFGNRKPESAVTGEQPSAPAAPGHAPKLQQHSESEAASRDHSPPKLSRQTLAKADRNVLLTLGKDDGEVQLRSVLRGTTPFIGRKHYAIVTPADGADWVTPISVDRDGRLRGDPQFGERNVGIGDSFTVRVLVTNSSLSPGILPNVPEDAIFSDPIVVARQL